MSVEIIGNKKSDPMLARITLGFVRSVRGLMRIIASTPTASAVLSKVPIFPGFSMPSAINTNGVVDKVRSVNFVWDKEARAINPSGCSR